MWDPLHLCLMWDPLHLCLMWDPLHLCLIWDPLHLCFVWDPLDLHWLVECCFTSTETVGLLGMGAQDGHLDFHTAPELCLMFSVGPNTYSVEPSILVLSVGPSRLMHSVGPTRLTFSL